MNKDKLNLIELKIGDELFSALKEINLITKIPLTKIVISILNEKLEDIKGLDYNKKFIEDYKNIDNDLETQIRFRIYEKEKIFLEEQIKRTGNNSLTSEIKYRLLNSIYKNKYFLPIELSEFKNLTFQIKRIGLNINGIFKRVNFKEELKSDDYINLQNSINEVNKKIDLMNNEIKNILKLASNRD
ncbi:hypothetical protein H0A43_03315 [Arcobacter lanthieri]|uniref:hypothetical protein n=1 Tax=Aliarcobacter lanthieri TaxID=1355374 RepID=UPI001923B66A|nr:hypothetical protein [Aliarcobacter lanthieri]MBL3519486.1 hypothetical protein [Aliarcobacter lanthieri]